MGVPRLRTLVQRAVECKEMNRHRLAEERSIALHGAVADRLSDDGAVLERARTRVHKWLETDEVATYWAQEWDRVLSKPLAEIQAFLVERSEHATALRQMTPFAGAIDPRTRWRIWRDVRQTFEQSS